LHNKSSGHANQEGRVIVKGRAHRQDISFTPFPNCQKYD
jgi:hypothetical protein